MFKWLYHPERVGTRCPDLFKSNAYQYIRISHSTDKHLHLNSTYMLRKDLRVCLLDYLTIIIAIIRFVLPFIGHIVYASEKKPLFESRGD